MTSTSPAWSPALHLLKHREQALFTKAASLRAVRAMSTQELPRD